MNYFHNFFISMKINHFIVKINITSVLKIVLLQENYFIMFNLPDDH